MFWVYFHTYLMHWGKCEAFNEIQLTSDYTHICMRCLYISYCACVDEQYVCITIFGIFLLKILILTTDLGGCMCERICRESNHCTVLSDTCIPNRFELYQYWMYIISSLHACIQVNRIITGIYVLLIQTVWITLSP